MIKKLERNCKFIDYQVKIFLKLLLPLFFVAIIWVEVHWLLGLLSFLAWLVFVVALRLVKAGAEADRCMEKEFERFIKENKKENEN